MTRLSLLFIALVAVFSTTSAMTAIQKPSTEQVVAELFKLLGVSADAATCVSDVGGADMDFRNFAYDIRAKNFSSALGELSSGLSAISTSVSGCGVPQIQTRIDALAAACKFANISTKGFDNAVKILVGASDMWTAVDGLATAIESGDPSSIANAINSFLSTWSSVTGGCGTSKACSMIDGILRILSAVAGDIQPCEAALGPAVTNLTNAVMAFEQKQYQEAVSNLASGLDSIAIALGDDACGLKNLGELIEAVAPKLGAAIVKIEGSNTVQIIVGDADLYDDIYQLVTAFKSGNWPTVGMELGKLLQALRASNCKTPGCVVLQGILGELQIAATDFETCSTDIDNAWNDFTAVSTQFKAHEYGTAIESLAAALGAVGQSVSGCGIADLGETIEKAATALGDNGLAKDVGSIVQILVSGADVSQDIAQFTADMEAKRWSSVGNDLSTFASLLTSSHCTTTMCKIVEGMLDMVATALTDLQPCEQSLESARTDFDAGVAAFENKQFGSAVESFASALSDISHSVNLCGLEQELGYLQQEANLFGFANTSIIGEAAAVILHGSNFYNELFSAFTDVSSHDYRGAGQNLISVLQQLSQWTSGHACSSDLCYTVLGVLQAVTDFTGNIKACENDFEEAWGNFTMGFNEVVSTHNDPIFHWSHDSAAIKAGIGNFGQGFNALADAVKDCDLQDIADLLAKLGAKLGLTPEISWIEEVLHILIDSVDIEHEVSNACDDFADSNWPGFGYNMAKLIYTLVE